MLCEYVSGLFTSRRRPPESQWSFCNALGPLGPAHQVPPLPAGLQTNLRVQPSPRGKNGLIQNIFFEEYFPKEDNFSYKTSL